MDNELKQWRKRFVKEGLYELSEDYITTIDVTRMENDKEKNQNNMKTFEIITTQQPGIVTFDNYETIKENITRYVTESFTNVDYTIAGLDAATADRDELKKTKDVITKTKKELKSAYSAPYVEIEKKLDELIKIIDGPYKIAKEFVDEAEANAKIYFELKKLYE